jgi:hypothetical protein
VAMIPSEVHSRALQNHKGTDYIASICLDKDRAGEELTMVGNRLHLFKYPFNGGAARAETQVKKWLQASKVGNTPIRLIVGAKHKLYEPLRKTLIKAGFASALVPLKTGYLFVAMLHVDKVDESGQLAHLSAR